MEKTQPKIIIIGAGMSGLIAAKQLTPYFDCKILEASDRVGGRVYTAYFQESPMELGAVAIQGAENNPIMAMAQKMNLALAKIVEEDIQLLDEEGRPVSTEQFKLWNTLYFDLCDKASENKNMSLSEGIAHILNVDESLKNQIPASFIYWKNKMLSAYFGMDLNQLSAEFYPQEKILTGGNYAVTGGYGKIIEYLKPENFNIRLSSKVTEIDYRNKAIIKITTENKEVFECQAVVVTVPLGVLKKQDILFNPELPALKNTAIQKMDMGVLNKFILFFDECFWPKDIRKFACLHPDAKVPIFFNYYGALKKPMLAGFVGGSEAEKLENLSDPEITQLICEELKRLFQKNIPEPSKMFVTRWLKQPGYYGSYSCLRSGVPANIYDELAEPVENSVFFAGEATMKDFPGTVHGAYFSGIIAARKILQKFGIEPQRPDEVDRVYENLADMARVKI